MTRPVSLPLRQSAFDAAIIDLDGTLVDTLGDFTQALNLMLQELALPGPTEMTPALVGQMVGKGSEHLVKSVLNHVMAQSLRAVDATNSIAKSSLPDHDDRALDAYQKHYRAINGQHSSVYPGAAQGLESLHRSGIKMACLTNKPLAFASDLLRIKGLDGYFSCVFGGDSFARKKPDPLPLLGTCAALGTAPARTLMVGDSSNDAQAARAAGCPVLLVTYGYNHGEPVRQVDADGFLDSLAELCPASACLTAAR